MNKNIFSRILVIITLVATVIINSLANALPLNGVTTGQISDSFDVLFVPAGYVFSIWGIIYLALGGYVIYQALPAQRHNTYLQSITVPFIIGAIANSAWIFFWHYGLLTLSVVAMLTLLITLITIYLKVNAIPNMTTGDKWFVRLPFSIYLGWISVATIANVTVLLFDANWSQLGLSAELWTVIMLTVGVALAGLMAFLRRDPIYLAVLVWAFAGIGVAQADTPTVATTAWLASALVAIMAIGALVTSFSRTKSLVWSTA